MTEDYFAWISKRYPDAATACCRCEEATKEMVQAFPELRRVGGWVAGSPMRRPRRGAEHWWCVTPDGCIVDPTRAQFLWAEIYYREKTAEDPEPIGKCLHCGGYCWAVHPDTGIPVPDASSSFCGAFCRREFEQEGNY